MVHRKPRKPKQTQQQVEDTRQVEDKQQISVKIDSQVALLLKYAGLAVRDATQGSIVEGAVRRYIDSLPPETHHIMDILAKRDQVELRIHGRTKKPPAA